MDLAKKLKHYRISQSELQLITEKLGRPPEGLEWPLFSALWSEHCSYKSSKVHLRKFFGKNERVVTASGENAGVIDLGQGERVAFKMESHNHPSFIEPYQGAATGVGGILRDIFTMGARPILLSNYLCFGEPKAARMSSLVDGVVRGISGYGNCVGVANVTGQTEFHSSYNKNILVNALALGLFRPGEDIYLSKAEGIGNLVVYVGAKTGKDGVHGASMASESFDDKSESKKPTIQKGDPFFEKLLIESCIEVMHSGLVVAIQDMGAAGLTSSSFEMASKGEVGMRMHLDKVPLRDSSMTPEEILLSESQERMLLVCEPKNLPAIQKIFRKWDLDAEAIGELTKGPEIELLWHNEIVCKIDPKHLVEEAPRYERPYVQWKPKNKVEDIAPHRLGVADASAQLLEILGDARGTSRKWIYEQYDQRVGARTRRDCSDSVGVVKLPDSGRLLAMVLGCRPHWMRTDAQIGAIDAVAYPSIELSAKGFEPLAVTDCLNFGNPENPDIMSEFVTSVESLSAQCVALNTPVISGNVSLYNETLGVGITSTPATGVVGLRENTTGDNDLPRSEFVDVGDDIFIVSMKGVESNGRLSEILKKSSVFKGELSANRVADFCAAIRKLALLEGVKSSRVAGQFGLAYTLARMTLGGKGAEVRLDRAGIFDENLYEVVFSVAPAAAAEFGNVFNEAKASNPFHLERAGTVRGADLIISDKSSEKLRVPVKKIADTYFNGWEKNFEFMA